MTTQRIRRFALLVLFPILIVLAIVYLIRVSQEEDAEIRASGTVEALEVVIAPEVAGRIVEVLVDEGDHVEAGDLLIQLDDELLQAQRERAEAAVRTAEATVDSAQVNLELLNLQVELTHRAERRAYQPVREDSWQAGMPVEFDLPIWYFAQAEQITAAEKGVDQALESLQDEEAKLKEVLGESSVADLMEAEARLADARASFLIAEDVLDRARRARDDQELEDYAEELFEAAKTELEAAQSAYEELLSDKDAEDVLEARARTAVAQERYDAALDQLAELQTGEHSLQLRIAERGLDQAHAAVVQAEATLAQARAELKVIDMQLTKLVLNAPMSGVVVTRSVENGEVLQPGAVAMTIAQLNELTITVFVQENRYGQIQLGQSVIVTVDSFPEETFSATVTKIADQAEYTPRNVQTEEGRRTTVFAIELKLTDPTGRLKPGMPADVEFIE